MRAESASLISMFVAIFCSFTGAFVAIIASKKKARLKKELK